MQMRKISVNTMIFLVVVLLFVVQRSWIPAVIAGTATILSGVADFLRRK